jgi:uncharacterized protein (DUF433 family)
MQTNLTPYNPPPLRPAKSDSPYVVVDDHGVMRVAGTSLPIESILYSFRDGDAPETIQRNFRSASLEQVYGVIAYYLGHRSALDDYLRSYEEYARYSREYWDAQPSPVRDRLVALTKQRDASRTT